MPCFFPLRGFRNVFPEASGKYRITGIRARSREDPTPPGCCAVDLPCGQCIGCRLDYSRKWAVRVMHEASMYPDNCFITLTYDDKNLPEFGDLDKSAFPKFFKRLRKKYGAGPRYFHCGEYGDSFGRPHYHACIFNFDFRDRELFSEKNGTRLFISADLAKLWPFGFSTVGDVTFDSAAYVARYVLKKVTGKESASHYTVLDPFTGELHERPKEYLTMSRRPGIGRSWFDKFRTDVYPDDFIIANGKKIKPPRYYDSLFEHSDTVVMNEIRERRANLSYANKDDNTLSRLSVRAEVADGKLNLTKRVLK